MPGTDRRERAMNHIKLLTTCLLALGAAGAASATTASSAAAPGADDVAAAARCIVRHLPQGAQMFRAADGTMKVVMIGRRGNAARWTISGAAADLRVAQDGGPAGVARAVAGTCY